MDWYLKVLKNYAVFEGRARRKEYWMFVLVNLLISLVLSFVDGVLDTDRIIQSTYSLVLFVPSIAVAARRLHDTNRSGWGQLIALIPLVGWIIIIVMLAQDGDEAPNEHGSNPKLEPDLPAV